MSPFAKEEKGQSDPPTRLKKAWLDNITLVPASRLPFKGSYQQEANRLPMGSVLCVSGTPRQQHILTQVTQFFKTHGRRVFILPRERFP